jgi:CrcB protein
MTNLLLIAAAGGAGALARYGLGLGVQRLTGSEFPLGTLVVNLVGCLAFGLIAGLAEQRLPLTKETELVIFTGFMGAFTTFSTYAFHTGLFLHEKQWGWAVLNLAGHNVIGVALLLIGLVIGRSFA